MLNIGNGMLEMTARKLSIIKANATFLKDSKQNNVLGKNTQNNNFIVHAIRKRTR